MTDIAYDSLGRLVSAGNDPNTLLPYKPWQWVFFEAGMSMLPLGVGMRAGNGQLTGWVKRSEFNKLDPLIQKMVAESIEKGKAAPVAKSGIIKLTASEAAKRGTRKRSRYWVKGAFEFMATQWPYLF